jgi:hypothetical protein
MGFSCIAPPPARPYRRVLITLAKRHRLANFFINDRLIPVARQENVLVVHPHAQRTGGGAFRNRVLVPVFGEDRVYAKLFVPDGRRWSRLTDADLATYRAYTDLHNFTDIGLKRAYICVALLRDPLYRAFSLYQYAKGTPDHRHHALAARSDAEEFYRRASPRDPTWFRNVQCRRICGFGSARRALEFIQSRYIGVGFTDELGEFVHALCAAMAWPDIMLKSRGRDEARYGAEVSARFRAMVLADNREDQLLFEIMSSGRFYEHPTGSFGRQLRTFGTEVRDLSLAAFRRVARI